MHQLPFTALLNHLLAGPVTALLNAIGIHPVHPNAPIPDYLAMEILVAIVLTVFFVAVRASLSVENPGTLQHMMEAVYNFIDAQSEEIIGHDNKRYISYLTVLTLFILCSNLLGLIPFFETPTGTPVVPLGCAVVTWFYYQLHGLRANGPGYIKHFLGPVWWLAPLMFVIEVCSHLARMMSLTIRLYANMFAGDMVTLVFFSLVPVGLPVIFLGLHFGVALIQTFIFMLLAMVYLGEATAHEH
ncbi:MAG: F0F1 ATP synthase subunit A [Acidobacteriota bacterium]|nr:F0F1 ATP synthase subunit A [Acidobacteriota bacterium]